MRQTFIIIIIAFLPFFVCSQTIQNDSVYAIRLTNLHNPSRVKEIKLNSNIRIRTNDRILFKTTDDYSIINGAIVFNEKDTVLMENVKTLKGKYIKSNVLKAVGYSLIFVSNIAYIWALYSVDFYEFFQIFISSIPIYISGILLIDFDKREFSSELWLMETVKVKNKTKNKKS